jgi:nitrite reductase (NADH) large subunit
MATVRLVDELSRRALGRYAIAVVGAEPRLAYNRVLLSSVLAREVSPAEIELRDAAWWRARGVTLLYGTRAVAIDTDVRRVRLAGGASLPYGKLVLATGSQPIQLDVPGVDMPGVMTFRDLSDVQAMAAAGAARKRAVVIGGGLLGLEAAYGLAKAGAEVAIVHLMDRLMERQLDGQAAGMLREEFERRGIAVHVATQTAAFRGKGRVEAVALTDGRELAADLVVVATGVRPRVALAQTADVGVNRGIVVDDRLQTDRAGIYAIGECAEHRGVCYGLVEPAHEQARVLAEHLSGAPAAYRGSAIATNLKVAGINVYSAGDFMGAAGAETIVFSDPALGIYKKLVIKDGRLTGAVLFGDTADGLWYLDLIRSGEPIAAFRDDLVFGRAMLDRHAA